MSRIINEVNYKDEFLSKLQWRGSEKRVSKSKADISITITKSNRMAFSLIQLKDIWEEAEGMQENLDRLKRDSGTREASVRAYKKFLDSQGRSDEYKDLTDDEIMTVDRFGKYLYFHEERWMETDEKGRAELMKKGNGIIYLDQHTIALDKEGNVLFKDKSKASEIINVKGAIASEIEDLQTTAKRKSQEKDER